MKTLFLTAVTILFCLSAFSQRNMDDVVYLKNGSKIMGTILQIYPDSIVQIKQAGGSVWIFTMKEVLMIAKEEHAKYKSTIVEAKGLHFGADAGVLVGAGNSKFRAPLSVNVLASYHFTPAFAVGAGTGLEFFENTQAPVYLDVRYYFNKKYFAPFLFMQGGAMFPLGKKETSYDGFVYKGKTGYLINPGFGFLFPMSERSAFSLSFSYRYHELNASREKSPLTEYLRIERMNRFNLRIGFILR